MGDTRWAHFWAETVDIKACRHRKASSGGKNCCSLLEHRVAFGYKGCGPAVVRDGVARDRTLLGGAVSSQWRRFRQPDQGERMATAKNAPAKKAATKAPKKAAAKKSPAKKAPKKKAPKKKAPAKKKAAKAPTTGASTPKASSRPKPTARPAASVKKAAAKGAGAKAAAKAASPVKDKMTKSGILNELAARTAMSRKQVGTVLDELESLIGRHIQKRGVGEFALPGLLKIRAVKRPATKRRQGRNPKTGDPITIAPKPASVRVRVTALKRLKAMVAA
jgi:nucleoid DNA-binding protein